MMNYSPQRFSMLPVVLKNLLIINAIGFLAYFVFKHSFGIDLNRLLGIYYFESEFFRPYQFVTYMFMHGNFYHLFFNMFALWMFGYLLENLWGSKRFFIYYFVTGLGAIVVQMIVNFIQFYPIQNAIEIYANNPNPADFQYILTEYFNGYFNPALVDGFMKKFFFSPENLAYQNESLQILENLYDFRLNIPTVGASGAVFGILLAFGMLFPNQYIYLYFFFPIKAKWFVIFYGLLELFLGLSNRPGDNVAHFAHLGGMIFGFFLIRHWRRRSFNYFE